MIFQKYWKKREKCYDIEYRRICPSCEDSYHKDDENSKHFFITKDLAKDTGMDIGLYKVLKYPFFWGNIVFGFESFFEDRIEKISDLDIVKAKQIEEGNRDYEYSDFICIECLEKYTRKDNYIYALPYYNILREKKQDDQNAAYSDERKQQIKQIRQRMIHSRISFRGYLQSINTIEK